MIITIPFPQEPDTSSYGDIKAYLKQLELAVHHAQKSVESAEANGVIVTADCVVQFVHPSLEGLKTFEGNPDDFPSNYYDELQNIHLEISLN
jgi:hypothetical protein